jgi:dienelactone hydrolase
MVAALIVLTTARVSWSQAPGPLLTPTGRWGVGSTSVEVVDESRRLPTTTQPRRLILNLWYPTTPPSTGARAPYVPWLARAGGALSEAQVAALREVRTHATGAAIARPPRAGFPLVLFAHGEQMGAALYSNLHEELASHGFVVAAVDHPGIALVAAYADGSAVSYQERDKPQSTTQGYGSALLRYQRARLDAQAADLRFVRSHIAQVTIRGQPLSAVIGSHVGSYGHSSGGLAATTLCQQEPVVDACANMDGRLDGAPLVSAPEVRPPSRPFLYIRKPFRSLTAAELSEAQLTETQAARAQMETTVRDRALLARSGPPSFLAIVREASHESFSDEALLMSDGDLAEVGRMRALRELLVDFFRSTLSAGSRSTLVQRTTPVLDLSVIARRPPR